MPDTPEIIDAEIVPDPAPLPPVPTTTTPDYDERGVPSFDHVRNKIEGRYATSIGATELADETEAARSFDEQQAAREKAAKKKLEEIRRSLGS